MEYYTSRVLSSQYNLDSLDKLREIKTKDSLEKDRWFKPRIVYKRIGGLNQG